VVRSLSKLSKPIIRGFKNIHISGYNGGKVEARVQEKRRGAHCFFMALVSLIKAVLSMHGAVIISRPSVYQSAIDLNFMEALMLARST
jgi:hypothetical protein